MTTSERTVDPRRIIGGELLEKSDLLNSSSNINAKHIGNGSVSDAEFNALDGVTSNIQAQINGISGQITAGPAGTKTYDGTCVIVTSSTITTRYCPTYIETLLNGTTVSKIAATGTYNSGTGVMTYTNGITVNDDGSTSGIEKLAAYLNANNVYQEGFSNLYLGDVIFGGRVSEIYTANIISDPSDNFTFNQLNGQKQKLTINGTGSCTINFTNLVPAVIILAIVPVDGCSVTIGTITNSGTITDKFKVDSLSFPETLASGFVYTFIMDVQEQAIHFHGKSITAPF